MANHDHYSFQGYACRCPEGLTGAFCNVNVTTCGDNDRRQCNVVNPMTFGGESFAEYEAVRSLERHMSVSLGLKTRSPSGNIMYARGDVDYSILEMDGGALR